MNAERIVPRCPTVLAKGSKVEQSHRNQVNINTIMAKYHKTGLLPSSFTPGTYGDFDQPGDYLEAIQRIEAAKAQFQALPSDVRRRFENDPVQFLAFMHDDVNYDEAVTLGLVKPKPVPVTPEPKPEE